MKKRGLGKGLEVLLGDSAVTESEVHANIQMLAIDKLRPNPYQPRTVFDEVTLAELADSIRQHGIIQPLAVRLVSGQKDQYEIIAGERRFRAAQLAKLSELPVVVHDVSNADSAALALIENLQREDLTVIEKARGIKQLINNFKLTHEACGKVLGQSRSAISNTLRLLDLSEPVQQAISEKKIDMGHARALLSVEQAEQQALLQKILLSGLSVRETEALIRDRINAPRTPRLKKNCFVKQTEIKLSEHLKTKVNISQQVGGGGKITVAFSDQKTLKQLVARLGLNSNSE
ncbi:MAG: chromosome partitioning protein ParB [Gammaproteobacteria bacterium]|nr:MAG: chromosome partitioning protein ParB [Gammaproteobacteria bacterium]